MEIKVNLEITLVKADGPRQDREAVIEQLLEDIENKVANVWVQDEDHDEETKYEVRTVSEVLKF